MLHTFSVQMAEELGVRSAIIYNIIQCTPCVTISKEYILHVAGSYMTEEEIDHALEILKIAKKIKGKLRFSILEGGK